MELVDIQYLGYWSLIAMWVQIPLLVYEKNKYKKNTIYKAAIYIYKYLDEILCEKYVSKL